MRIRLTAQQREQIETALQSATMRDGRLLADVSRGAWPDDAVYFDIAELTEKQANEVRRIAGTATAKQPSKECHDEATRYRQRIYRHPRAAGHLHSAKGIF